MRTLSRCPLCGGRLQQPWNAGEDWRCKDCGARVSGPREVEPLEPNEETL